MDSLISVALGGSLGALTRFYTSKLFISFFDSKFPWATLFVNLIGSFIMGFVYTNFEKNIVSDHLRLLVTIGFIGAFTTFSTFSIETINLLKNENLRLAILNIILNNIGGLIFVISGIFLSQFLLNK